MKREIIKYLANLPGWKSDRKIIVIESDDWGSIRMPSRGVYDSLKNNNIDIETDDNHRFNMYDSLATTDDLELLLELLSQVKDLKGHTAVMTPICIVANPAFDRIKDSGFTEYFYEPFTDTLKRQKGCENSFSLWKEGIENRLFVPQFHGREHLNVEVWMKALRMNHKETRIAFDHGIWGFNNINAKGIFYNAAFELDDPSELGQHHEIITDGLKLFQKLFGYIAEYFVAPNGPVNNHLLRTAADNGIKYICGSKLQKESLGNEKTRMHFHWSGQKNSYGQTYLTRNAFFEPSIENRDWVDTCLAEIGAAFKWRKPAVISSHRVNYIGALYPENRDKGLRELKRLLQGIIKSWPDTEFMTSAELGRLISGEK